jgi:hypothetical protein
LFHDFFRFTLNLTKPAIAANETYSSLITVAVAGAAATRLRDAIKTEKFPDDLQRFGIAAMFTNAVIIGRTIHDDFHFSRTTKYTNDTKQIF